MDLISQSALWPSLKKVPLESFIAAIVEKKVTEGVSKPLHEVCSTFYIILGSHHVDLLTAATISPENEAQFINIKSLSIIMGQYSLLDESDEEVEAVNEGLSIDFRSLQVSTTGVARTLVLDQQTPLTIYPRIQKVKITENISFVASYRTNSVQFQSKFVRWCRHNNLWLHTNNQSHHHNWKTGISRANYQT